MFDCEIAISEGRNVCLKDNLIDYTIDPTETYQYCTDNMKRSDIDLQTKTTSIPDEGTFLSEKRSYINMLRWTCPKNPDCFQNLNLQQN